MPDPTTPPRTLPLVDPVSGDFFNIPEADAPYYLDRGWKSQTAGDVGAAALRGARETDYGGVGGAVKATLAAGARGATLGASDVAARVLGGDETADTLRNLREYHPGLSAGAEVVGAVLPAFFTAGESLPASVAARAGRGVAEAAGGGIRGAIAGGVAEGAMYGAGQGVSEIFLSPDRRMTFGHMAAAIGSNALYGAASGGVASGALKGVEAGLGAAKRVVDRALLSRSEGRAMTAVAGLEADAAAHPPAIGPETDLSLLDQKGLKLAREQEVEAIGAAQAPERQAFVDDLRAARETSKEEKTWIATQNGKTREVRELGKATLDADKRIDSLLKVEADLVDKPQRTLSALRQQEQALAKLQEWGERETQRYIDEVAGARDQIRSDLLANKYKDKGFVFGKGAISPDSPVVDDIAERMFQEQYPHPDRLPTNLQVLTAVPNALERNRALQDRLAKFAEAPSSPRLSAIDAADEARGVKTAPPKPESEGAVGEVLKVAASAVPFGAVVTKAAGALGGLKKAIGAAGERVGRAASTFLGKAAPVAGKAAELAPPVATKVLAALRYGDPETDERGRRVDKPEPKTLPELYQARTDEIRSQVQLAPDGTYQMKPAARVRMAARLSGLGVVDPIAADRLESAGAARIAWLASQMPRRPDLAGLPAGPDTWNPSDAAMRGWTRKAAAAEDPYGVLERASAGAKARVVPEEIMALRALHPELLNDYVTRIITGLPERRTRLPYAQRLSLSMLTGRPLDPAMTPAVLRELQSMHAGEPGTMGGTQAPRAQAKFGSVKRSETGTPAQRRQGVGL